jgi:hypothetical protein
MIPFGNRLHPPLNDPADLLRRLHPASLAQLSTCTQSR